MGGEYEFEVGQGLQNTYDAALKRIARSMHWLVQLPHQCDSWEVVSTPDRADALTKLDVFIAEVQAAREQLATMPEQPEGSVD